MKTVYDIQQFLKQFGIIIYIGDRLADLELMEMEVRQLYQSQLMEAKDFQMAMLILGREITREKEKRKRRGERGSRYE